MQFVKLGTRYYLAAPVLQLSADAEVALVRSKAYAGSEETSGFVPAAALPLLVKGHTPAKGRRVAAELVTAGLWTSAEGGWVLPEWHEEQAEMELLLQRRRADAERQRRHRAQTAGDASADGERDSGVTSQPMSRDKSREPIRDRLSRARDRDSELEEDKEQNPSSASADAEPDGEPEPQSRPDVERLCALMVELVVGNGHRRPNVTKAWRQQARLLLDADGVPLDLAEHVMRWAAQDSFWSPNVRSLPKFRQQFTVLRARRREEHERNKRLATGTNGHQPTARERALNPHLFATPIGGQP